jgi:hypothetical protein
MSARCLIVVASAMIALAPIQATAKGQPTPVHVIAAVPPVMPRALPDLSADKLLKGCGNHRYRDLTTQKCRSF